MSEFPSPDSHRTAVSQSHIRTLDRYGIDTAFPFAVRREKGAYVTDIDGNKYVDFLLGGGSVILGHNDGRLTHYVKNALSTGTSRTFANKFLSRLLRTLSSFADFARAAFFETERSALTALLSRYIGPSDAPVGVNTEYLLRLARSCCPFAKVEIASAGKRYGLALLEPVEFDKALEDTDFSRYDAERFVSCETRSAFRFRCGFLKTCDERTDVISGANLANGLGGAIWLSKGKGPDGGVLLPMYLAVAMNETLKTYQRTIDYARFEFGLPDELAPARRGSAALLREPPDSGELLKRGVITGGKLAFLSAAHTEHDVKRLIRAIGQ